MAKKQTQPEEKKIDAPGTALAEQAASNVPAVIDYGADAQEYQSEFGMADVALPFIQILQKMSPQVDEGDDRFVPGAKPGLFINTVTKELFESFEYVPAKYKRSFIEWVPREKGGGIVKEYGITEGEALIAKCTKDDKGKDVLPNGNHLVQTFTYVGGMNHAERGFDPSILSASSTGIKKAKALNSRISGLKTPQGQSLAGVPWAGKYLVKTVRESNDKGAWFNWEFTPLGFSNAGEYASGRSLRKALDGGAVKVDMAQSQVTEERDGREPGADDTEVPF